METGPPSIVRAEETSEIALGFAAPKALANASNFFRFLGVSRTKRSTSAVISGAPRRMAAVAPTTIASSLTLSRAATTAARTFASESVTAILALSEEECPTLQGHQHGVKDRVQIEGMDLGNAHAHPLLSLGHTPRELIDVERVINGRVGFVRWVHVFECSAGSAVRQPCGARSGLIPTACSSPRSSSTSRSASPPPSPRSSHSSASWREPCDPAHTRKSSRQFFRTASRTTSTGNFNTPAIASIARGTVDGSFRSPASGPMYGASVSVSNRSSGTS